MPLVGREPNFDHTHVWGQVGVAPQFLANSLYGTSFVSRAWRRSRMACAGARRESIRGHDVSVFFVLRRKEAIQPMFLILLHAGLEQGGMPASFPGPFMLHQVTSLQMRRRVTHPPWPSENGALRQRSPKAMEAWWCRPRKEPGAGLLRSWKQSGPRLGPPTTLWPGSQNGELTVNPRRRDAERRGSRPRVRTDFTANPRWDLVSSRVGRWNLRMGGRLGSRGVLMRKRSTVSTARCNNTNKERQRVSRYPAHSSLGIRCSSMPQRTTSRAARYRQSSAASVRARNSETLRNLNVTVGPRRRTHWRSFSAIAVGTSSPAAIL
jgi:hypothetical protein